MVSEKSTLEIHVVNKGISQCNPGLCLLYLPMTVLLSELAATQATSYFIFMTSERSGGKNTHKTTSGESIADGSKARILTVTSRKSNLVLLRLRKSEVILRSKH